MIIDCPWCQKKFEVNEKLIPEIGRTLQCGFCNKKWFFKKREYKESIESSGFDQKLNNKRDDIIIDEKKISPKIYQ